MSYINNVGIGMLILDCTVDIMPASSAFVARVWPVRDGVGHDDE